MGLTLYTAKYAREVPDNPNGWWVMTTDKSGKVVGEQVRGGPGGVARALGYGA